MLKIRLIYTFENNDSDPIAGVDLINFPEILYPHIYRISNIFARILHIFFGLDLGKSIAMIRH